MSKYNINNLMNKISNESKNDIWFSNSCGMGLNICFQDYRVLNYYKKECKNTSDTKVLQKFSDIGYNVSYQDKYSNDVYFCLKKKYFNRRTAETLFFNA